MPSGSLESSGSGWRPTERWSRRAHRQGARPAQRCRPDVRACKSCAALLVGSKDPTPHLTARCRGRGQSWREAGDSTRQTDGLIARSSRQTPHAVTPATAAFPSLRDRGSFSTRSMCRRTLSTDGSPFRNTSLLDTAETKQLADRTPRQLIFRSHPFVDYGFARRCTRHRPPFV